MEAQGRGAELDLPASIPTAPEFLPPAAIEEWHRVTSIAEYSSAFSQADRPSIALYCGLWAEYVTGYNTGQPMQTSRMALMFSIAAKLGYNPADRSKVPTKQPEKAVNPFAQIDGPDSQPIVQ